MRIILTGALGFIGSNFLHYLKQQNPLHDICVVDAGTYAANKYNISPLQPGRDFMLAMGRIEDTRKMEEIFYNFKPDLVVNFAAETHVDNSLAHPYPFVMSNIMGTVSLLETVKKFKVPHMVHISTDEVIVHSKPFINTMEFGSQTTAPGEWSFIRPYEMDWVYETNSPYSASKASAELFIQAYRKSFNLPVTVVRCTNNYGPRQNKEKLIPKIISNALEDKKIPVYGKGEQWRDWLYVEDFCKAIDLISRQSPGELWHVSANNETQNIEMIKKILTKLNKSDTLIEYVEDRPGHDYSYSLNSDKLRKLGWKPLVNLDEGLERTIRWHTEKK